MKYNLEGSDIHKMAKDLSGFFEHKWPEMLKSRGTKRPAEDMAPGGAPLPPAPLSGLDEGSGVSDTERRELGNKINTLNGENLGRLVDLVQEEMPKSFEQYTETECEINIDKLDRRGFDKLMKFVTTCD